MAEVVISGRFRGPPNSGHGGYSCAMAAQFVDGDAEVSLRVPPPLEKALAVEREDGRVRLLDGDAVVAEAHPVELELELPASVTVEEAEAAAERSPLLEYHPFATCFVCGTDRVEPDGVRFFPGPVEGRRLAAAPWYPDPSLADTNGVVGDEFVWSVLDCASGGAVPLLGEAGPMVLARFAASLRMPVRAGRPHVGTAWPIERDGRKLRTGAAVFTDEGRLCACALALWIELTDEQVAAVGTTS
jgi:hypothetical protein